MSPRILLTLFLFLFLGRIQAQNYNSSGKLLWEMRGKKGVSYVYGTLHSNDKRLFNFPDSVYYALDKTKMIALEVNVLDLFIKKDPRKNEANVTLDKNGNLYTPSNEPTETYYGNENGMPQFMDAYFQQYAEVSNKGCLALESITQQTKALEEIPFQEDQQRYALISQDPNTLLDLYLKGNLENLDRYLKGRMSSNNKAYQQLILNRNAFMARKIDSIAQKNTTFIAIGAGHLFGDEGVIQLLRKLGYAMRPIGLQNSEEVTESEKNIKRIKSDTLVWNEKSNLKVVFPGKPRKIKDENTESHRFVFKELGQGNTYQLEIIPRDSTLKALQYAEIFIASPPSSPYKFIIQEDGTEYFQGLSDEYPDGLKWVRVLCDDQNVIIARCFGGNKFMNSDRPNRFFNNIILEE